MKYETVKEAAERLGVTARTVQKAGTCNDPAEAMRGGVVCHSGCHKKKMRRLEES